MAWEGKSVIMEQNKCDDMRWYHLNGLPKNIIPYIKQAITCILGGKLYSEYGW